MLPRACDDNALCPTLRRAQRNVFCARSGPNRNRTTGRNRCEHLQHLLHQLLVHLTVVEQHQTPVAERAASTSSAFILARQSPCSTTTTVTLGSASSRRSFERYPIHPGADLDVHTDNRGSGS
jgi:hypothetical protein